MIARLVTRYWLLLPLLILVVVLLDRVEQPDVVQTEETIDMRQTQSDYYLSEFRTRKFGLDGTIEYIVEGDTLAHYPDDDRSEITRPRVTLRRENALWLVESQSGRFDPVPNLFTLQGGVTMQRKLPGTESATITMTTQTLRIATEANRVETDDVIEVVAPTWRLQAKGLRTAIDDGQLNLLSQVEGRYELPDVSNDATQQD